MNNKSDIIRRALMNYFSEEERTVVLQEIEFAALTHSNSDPPSGPSPSQAKLRKQK